MKIFIVFFIFCITVIGCGGKAIDIPPADEIPKGPGVFTNGDEGALVYDSEKGGFFPGKGSGDESDNTKPGVHDSDESDYKAFEEWKKNRDNDDEYQEFKEWQEWQRYKKWKEKNK